MANEIWGQRLGRLPATANGIELVEGYDLRARSNLDGPPRESSLMTTAQVGALVEEKTKKMLWIGLAAMVVGYLLLRR